MSKLAEVLTEVALIATLDGAPMMESVTWHVPNLRVPKRHRLVIELEPKKYKICAKAKGKKYFICKHVDVKESSKRQDVVINFGE